MIVNDLKGKKNKAFFLVGIEPGSLYPIAPFRRGRSERQAASIDWVRRAGLANQRIQPEKAPRSTTAVVRRRGAWFYNSFPSAPSFVSCPLSYPLQLLPQCRVAHRAWLINLHAFQFTSSSSSSPYLVPCNRRFRAAHASRRRRCGNPLVQLFRLYVSLIEFLLVAVTTWRSAQRVNI